MAEEVQHWPENGLDELRPEGAGGGRVGVLQGAQCDGGRDFNGGVEVVLDEGLVNVLHGRNKKRRRVVGVDEDFVSDGNGFDFSGRVVGGDVLLDPGVGEGEAFGGGEEELVGQIDGDLNAGAGESP